MLKNLSISVGILFLFSFSCKAQYWDLANQNTGGGAIINRISDLKDTIIVSILNTPSAKSNLVVSPNPTGSAFNFTYKADPSGNVTLKICDAVGKFFYSTIYKNFNGEINETIDLSGLAKGIYIIEVVGTRTKETKKLVLQ